MENASVDLGLVEINEELDQESIKSFSADLADLGFELIEDRDSQYVEAVKNAITKLIYKQQEALKKYTISVYIEEEVGKDYKWLSTLFSHKEGITIEHYVIAQKIERVKELISYNELSISEIADKLHYSSVAYLSNQFKKIMGFTPSEFKAIGTRKPLDKV